MPCAKNKPGARAKLRRMQRLAPRWLYNTAEIELWPADLLRARRNRDARLLARADIVLRRKRDGRFLATCTADAVHPLVPALGREPGLDAALDVLDGLSGPRPISATAIEGELPPSGLRERLQRLGIGDDYAHRTGLALVAEPAKLAFAGRDRYRRALWLTEAGARAWQALRHAALADGIVLEAISGYRGHDYQLGIFERKFARGQTLAQILAVNAAPGYSEHHGGNALDIGTPGELAAEESFERTLAFAWLQAHAGEHGFRMSYPRDNPHGIVYEPWHWCFIG